MFTRRLPPLYPLRAFESTARRMSFTLAAEELSISQSAVSHQVKSLEAYFGVPLFNRTRGNMRLTTEGRRLFNACEVAFMHLASISHDLPDSELRDTLTLSSPPLIFNWWLLPRLRAFTQRYPNIRFRFLHLVCGERVLPNEADIALFWDKHLPDGFFGTQMFKMSYCPVASPRLAATLPAKFEPSVIESSVLLHENDHEGWTNWTRLAGFGEIKPTSGWVFEDPGMMIEAAAMGEGIALGPFPLLEELVQSGRLIQLFGVQMATPNAYFLAISSRNVEKPSIRLFWNWFVQHGHPEAGLPEYNQILSQKPL